MRTVLNSVDSADGTPFITNFIQQIGVTAAWCVGNTTRGRVIRSPDARCLRRPLRRRGQPVTPVGGMALPVGSRVSSVGSGGGLGGAVTAGLGEAGSVGGLSVPASWSAAAPRNTGIFYGATGRVGLDCGRRGDSRKRRDRPGMPGMAACRQGRRWLGRPEVRDQADRHAEAGRGLIRSGSDSKKPGAHVTRLRPAVNPWAVRYPSCG